MEGVRVSLKLTGNACQPANLAFIIVERNLVGDVPLNQALRGGDQFDLVADSDAFFDDPLVVGRVAFLDIFRKEFRVWTADNGLFAFEAHEVGQLLVDVYEVAVGVLDEEQQSGDTVEKQLACIHNPILRDKMG